MYHQFNDLVREGDYYRIESYQENHYYDCFQVVSKDKKESLVFFVQVLARPSRHSKNIRLQGLCSDMEYTMQDVTVEPGKELLQETGKVAKGDTLMNAGMQVLNAWGDYQAKLFYFKAE